MILLTIDTVATLCAANVWSADAGRELGRAVRDPGKGHAEILMAVIDEALDQRLPGGFADLGHAGDLAGH